MQVFLTGGTGFIGSEVARRLLARGDRVRVLVHGGGGAPAGELVPGDLSDGDAIRRGLAGCEAAIHVAAIYEVGIRKSRRAAMYEANVQGTENVLRAAREAGTRKVVHVSTAAAFGNTRGRVVDETHERDPEYLSYYDETKHRAHETAKRFGAVIVCPGIVYGPGDRSDLGKMLQRFLDGKLPLLPFPELGGNFVHRDDVADGILVALDKGRPGETYVLGGQLGTMRDLVEAAASAAGRKPPRFTLPTAVVKLMAPLGPVIGPALGFPPNLREAIRSADGVTHWVSHAKAMRELGYRPRPLERGLPGHSRQPRPVKGRRRLRDGRALARRARRRQAPAEHGELDELRPLQDRCGGGMLALLRSTGHESAAEPPQRLVELAECP